MNSRRSKLLLVTVLIVLLISTVFAVTSTAAITVEKGAVVGLNPTKAYEYAPVDITTWTVPIYTKAETGVSKLTLDPGLYYIREVNATDKTVIHVPGTAKDMSGIGTLVMQSWGKESLKFSNYTGFIPGTWTGKGTSGNSAFATYYLSEIGGNHITSSDAAAVAAGTISRTKIKQKLEAIVFKYAYSPEEIIRVDELYTMSFSTGIRLGSLTYIYDTLPNTKYVLHVMGEDGQVTTHTALMPVAFDLYVGKTSCSTTHTLSIDSSFPDAKGWVVGLEIYPYGSVPAGARYGAAAYENYSGTYYNTMMFIEYKPSGYATKYSVQTSEIPTQYNGANTAYIKGYSNGSFAPDADITKAEVATILARLINNGSVPAGYTTDFADVSVNDWFYDSVAFLDSEYGFDYLDSAVLQPNKAITRGEFAQMIFSVSQSDAISSKDFKDVAKDDARYAAISTLASMNVFNGYEDKTFRPDATLTRAEAVTTINRLINLLADEKTVSLDSLENTFNDIDSHWAKYQILMAANDNVKSVNAAKTPNTGLVMTDSYAVFETNHVRINVSRTTGKVESIINKYNNTDVMASSATPWFIYLVTDGGINFYPSSINLVDGRMRVIFGNRMEAYFIVECFDNYITLELDSKLPLGVKALYFGITSINCAFSEDPESFRISSVSMNANTDYINFPGGSVKKTEARVMSGTGSTMGGKMGITFSKYGDRKTGDHRAFLKEIVDAIDPTVGTTSTHGGPYTLDNNDLFGDYVITSSGLSASSAQSVADTLNKYSVDQLDIHQGGSTFIQGEFNFVCAKQSGETFTTAAQFKERIGNTLTAAGIQLGLHTYSSLVASSATTILSDPKWQKDLLYEEDDLLTLSAAVTASDKTFTTNEDASHIVLYGNAAGGGTSYLPWNGPYTNYFLIEEEIFRVTVVSETGLSSITRAVCGTKAVSHPAGAEIRHLMGHYSMFQPTPGSDLFYHIADLTAQAYNDGGFEMIYLDGFESFDRSSMVDSSLTWYYYASFVQRIVSQCEIKPIIEGSAIPKGFWAARGRAGAVDHATRQFKKYNLNHARGSYNSYNPMYYTATLGWFNYAPDVTQAYKNTWQKTLFVDDLDHMGSLGIAFDYSTVYNHSIGSFSTYSTLARNASYFNLYSRLRKANYFSDNVKEVLRNGYLSGKEYKVEEQSDGTWAFREMTYVKNRIFDMADKTFVTGTATNPYEAHTPYIRIEQRYSTLGENAIKVYEFDETADVVSEKYTFDPLNLTNNRAFKIKVTGNGIDGSAILLTIGTTSKSETGRIDFFIPTHFTGTREFILMDMDNADHDGYSFTGYSTTNTSYETFRNGIYIQEVASVKVTTTGNCEGVKIDDLYAYTPTNAPAVDPSVTVGGSTMTFKATVRSGEYIEYYPENNKAYLHSYNVLSAGTNGNTATITEIPFTGKITVPEGDFTFTYNATGSTDAPLRAQVVLGLKSHELIANEDTWNVPEVDLAEDIQWSLVK